MGCAIFSVSEVPEYGVENYSEHSTMNTNDDPLQSSIATDPINDAETGGKMAEASTASMVEESNESIHSTQIRDLD